MPSPRGAPPPPSAHADAAMAAAHGGRAEPGMNDRPAFGVPFAQQDRSASAPAPAGSGGSMTLVSFPAWQERNASWV